MFSCEFGKIYKNIYFYRTPKVAATLKELLQIRFFLYVTEVAEKALSILFLTEAVTQRCSVKNAFLEILQNSQENSCARVSFSIKLKS